MRKEILEMDLPKIEKILSLVLKVDRYQKIERLGGLTNHTYHVCLENGKEYVLRIPGEGTEELIVRKNEKISTELACKLGIDANLLYFDENGTKVTEYIPNAMTMSAKKMREPQHIKQVASLFNKLHNCNLNTGIPFEVFDMASSYEKIINEHNVSMYDDYQEVKNQVMMIKQEIDNTCNTSRVPCHNDPLCENWIESNDRMYLIDWEYAGMNDAMWDLADISIEAVYTHEHDHMLLKEYYGITPDKKTWKHFYANKIYVDYLWTLWAKTRVPFDGQPMEDWARERYDRLKNNIEVIKNM